MNADRLFLEAAIELAEKGRFTCSPNPPVGCLICKDGEIIGRGFHERSGEAHAEVKAIESLTDGLQDLAGATIYVSLEPCAFKGRTPSCAKTLSQYPIQRIVVGAIDPHPKVAGEGIKILRDAGIQVDVIELDSAKRCIEGFQKRVSLGRPLVRLKTASSLDGATSLADGTSHWITSEESRKDVQYWRARSDAVVTGVGTVVADNPNLTVRADEYSMANQPIRVIFDSHARTPAKSNVLDGSTKTIIVHSTLVDQDEDALAFDRVEFISFSGDQPDIQEVIERLAVFGCNEILVECGPRLMGRFLQTDLWDEWLVYIAPKVLGHDANSLANIKIPNIDNSGVGRILDVKPLGPDIRLTIRPD